MREHDLAIAKAVPEEIANDWPIIYDRLMSWTLALLRGAGVRL
jgi:hypothetical protein